MRRHASLASFLFAALCVAACSTGDGATTTSAGGGAAAASTSASTGATSAGTGGAWAGGLPCDVDAILAAHCRSCHGAMPQFGAPMSLVTHADLVAPAVTDSKRPVYELVGQRIHDDAHAMPPQPNPRLGAADTKVVDDWIAGGAPASSDTCDGVGGGSSSGGVPAPDCVPDLHVVGTAPYTVPTDQSDVYVCYGVDVTEPQKRHITAFVPHIDNAKVVHHIVLYQADAAQPAGPGPCGTGLGRIVSVWAPGVKGFELPPQAGIPLEGTTHYALQIHYNNLQHLAGESDASGFDLCTTDTLRPNDADVLALGTFDIQIPAHGTLDETCELTVPPTLPLHIVGSMPHMHKLGTTIVTRNQPSGGGAPVDLGTRATWNFANQYWSTLDTVVKAGDVVSTRCAWNNPGDLPVFFGENTGNEMCFTFAMYYPKINVANWSWTYPAGAAKCKSTAP